MYYCKSFFRKPEPGEREAVLKQAKARLRNRTAGMAAFAVLIGGGVLFLSVLCFIEGSVGYGIMATLAGLICISLTCNASVVNRRQFRKLQREEFVVQNVTIKEIILNSPVMESNAVAELVDESGERTLLNIGTPRGFDSFFHSGNHGLLIILEDEPLKLFSFSSPFLFVKKEDMPSVE